MGLWSRADSVYNLKECKHVQDIDQLIPITAPELDKPGRLPMLRRVTQALVLGAILAGIAAPWQTYHECVNEWAGGPIPLVAFAACANAHRTEPLPRGPYTEPKP